MHRMWISRGAHGLAAAAACALFAVAGCGGAEAPGSSRASGPVETQVDGESFSSLDVSSDRLSGVFVKDGQSLAFDVDRRNGGAALRLSTESGKVLYSVVRNRDSTIDLQVGADFHATFPPPSRPGVSPVAPVAHPAPFQSSGDLAASLAALGGTVIDRLPYLSAALGRVGLDGAAAPLAAPLHLLSMRLTEALKLPFDPAVAGASNAIVAANVAARATAPSSVAPPAGSPQTGGTLTTDGLGGMPIINCPNGRAPCPSGYSAALSGPFSGCCMPTPAPPPPNFYGTAACVSGAAREVFTSLESNPCVDDCLGMCGPGCSPWLWVCGDTAVHAACWNHDSVYCPDTIDGFPNLDYPVCEAEFLAYSAVIGLDTVPLGSACDNTPTNDFETAPPFGLWTIVPTFYVQYQSFPQLQSPGAGSYYGSSILPGWDSWAHGPAQGGDHATSSGDSLFAFREDTNFFDSVVFHSDSGFLTWPLSSTAPGQWWAADLGATRNIQAITIYNRTDYQNYPNGLLNNFQLLIWNGSAWLPIADDSMFRVAADTSPYNDPPGPSGTVQVFTPGAGTNAEWVAIEKTDDNNLVVADVGIWAY